MAIACAPGLHRHDQTWSRCGITDLTVASTVTIDGNRWPPLCSGCSSRVHRQAKDRAIEAVARVEAAA